MGWSRRTTLAAVNLARLKVTPYILLSALYQLDTPEGRMVDGYERYGGSIEHLGAAADMSPVVYRRVSRTWQGDGGLRISF